MIVGSKKNMGSRNNGQSSRNNNAVRRTKPDMSKYAGAVSNKSKRNYADLKLVRPDNLKEYASKGARPRDGSGVRYNESQRTEHVKKSPPLKAASGSRSKSVPPKPPDRPPSGSQKKKRPPQKVSRPVSDRQPNPTKKVGNKAGNYISGFANMIGSLASGVSGFNVNADKKKSSANKPNGSVQSAKPPTSKKPPKAEYHQDEYSRALNNSDFYSSVVEKYYMKHPEELGKREKSGASRRRKPVNNSVSPKAGRTKEKIPISDKSVAEMAVKGRGTADKKNRAKVVKSGKAKGVVTSRAAHRRVRQRNRRQTVLINSMIIMIIVVFLIAVYVNVFFNVKNIEVKGQSPYDTAKIVSMCGFSDGDNILFIDSKGSENQVIQSLPYIESCTIKRRLPATVVVNVTEAEILGVTEITANQWAVISNKGKILETVTNLTVVSSSDVITSLTYDPEVSSADEVAVKRGLPILQGLDITEGTAGGYIEGEAVEQIGNFDWIVTEVKAFDMKITRMKVSDRGYEIEYDGRINIVLGEIADKSIMKRRIETANYIVCVSGDITEHDKGEITYLKNEAFYSPSYEVSDESLSSDNQDLSSQKAALVMDLNKKLAQEILDSVVESNEI